ncbi:MFS transporter [Marinomonas sp. TW1]|uniref:MFS transporter n=1 Tax=Marinomonas sp. TW1 TaxID=1561203 RepID=UPI0007AF72AB|nr:MFS transporter [Marinomonas sp. TW1]KZN13605.1 major facilitator transporter [Marinomonas sp. TW1]
MLGVSVWGLALGQALLITGNILLVSVTALIGQQLAPNLSLATLPVATQFLGLMGVILPAALLMRTVGRKKGFFIGNLIGIIGAFTAFYALQQTNFVLFCCATLLLGMAIGVGQQYRFAAIENAPNDKTPQAISLIMGAGVIAAILGPNMAIWAEFIVPDTQYLGAFAALLVLYIATTILILMLPLRQPTQEEQTGTPRSYKTLLKQPNLLAAITSGVIGYTVMTLVMTATPLAMHGHGFHFGHTATVIQWHVLGMFAPSFFTGKFIQKYGTTKVIQAGCLLLLICVVLNQFGSGYWYFWTALIFLGIGWNFTFIGATALLTKTYQPADKAKVQGLNDFLVFTGATIGSVLAGYWQNLFGWEILNLLMIPFILAAMLSVWLSARKSLPVITTETT